MLKGEEYFWRKSEILTEIEIFKLLCRDFISAFRLPLSLVRRHSRNIRFHEKTSCLSRCPSQNVSPSCEVASAGRIPSLYPGVEGGVGHRTPAGPEGGDAVAQERHYLPGVPDIYDGLIPWIYPWDLDTHARTCTYTHTHTHTHMHIHTHSL